MNSSTRETPHCRFLSFERKTSTGSAVPRWLLELEGAGEIWLRNFSRRSKSEPRVKAVQLVEAFPSHVRVKLPSGKVDFDK